LLFNIWYNLLGESIEVDILEKVTQPTSGAKPVQQIFIAVFLHQPDQLFLGRGVGIISVIEVMGMDFLYNGKKSILVFLLNQVRGENVAQIPVLGDGNNEL
jgi:hypothetical protein